MSRSLDNFFFNGAEFMRGMGDFPGFGGGPGFGSPFGGAFGGLGDGGNQRTGEWDDGVSRGSWRVQVVNLGGEEGN